MDQNERERERDRTGEIRFRNKTFVCLENMINKFERLSQNLTGNEKKAGMSHK